MGGDGAPGEIRTPDHLVGSQVLYPAELRARGSNEGAHPTTTHFPVAKGDKPCPINDLAARLTLIECSAPGIRAGGPGRCRSTRPGCPGSPRPPATGASS